MERLGTYEFVKLGLGRNLCKTHDDGDSKGCFWRAGRLIGSLYMPLALMIIKLAQRH